MSDPEACWWAELAGSLLQYADANGIKSRDVYTNGASISRYSDVDACALFHTHYVS